MPSYGVGLDAIQKRDKFPGARAKAMAPNESTVIAARRTRLSSLSKVFRTWGTGRREEVLKNQPLHSIF